MASRRQSATFVEQNLPLTLGLLVDTSMSMRDELSAEKSASQKFLDKC